MDFLCIKIGNKFLNKDGKVPDSKFQKKILAPDLTMF